MKYILILIISFALSGCFTPITNIEEYATRPQDKNLQVKTLDELLKKVFTDEAYDAIKDIPLESGPIATAMAAGSSFSSSIYQFVIGAGIGRKVLVNEEMLKKRDHGYSTIIHEYVHHLDDMTRDGEGNFIDIDSFVIGYAACFKTTEFHGITIFVESSQGDWITNNFGIGKHSERIAYTSQVIWKQECPLLLKIAYSKIFRKWQNIKYSPPYPQIDKDFLEYLQSE